MRYIALALLALLIGGCGGGGGGGGSENNSVPMLISLFLLVGVGGSIVNWFYWTIAGLANLVLFSPALIWIGVKSSRNTEFTKKQMTILTIFGALFTVPFALIWTFLCGWIVWIGIHNAGAYGWAKWLFITFGVGLAVMHPGADPGEAGPQITIHYWTILVGYVANVLLILYMMIPKIAMMEGIP